jgi:hypothetical protein
MMVPLPKFTLELNFHCKKKKKPLKRCGFGVIIKSQKQSPHEGDYQPYKNAQCKKDYSLACPPSEGAAPRHNLESGEWALTKYQTC